MTSTLTHRFEDNPTYKILILGDSSVGKTALMARFADEVFTGNYVTTIGVDFRLKEIQLEDGQRVTLQLWDTAGQEKFRTISPFFFRGAHGAVIVYDITNGPTFSHVQR